LIKEGWDILVTETEGKSRKVKDVKIPDNTAEKVRALWHSPKVFAWQIDKI